MDKAAMPPVRNHLNIEPRVLAKIAGICAQEVTGLLDTDGNVVETMVSTFRQNPDWTKGIDVTMGDHQVAIEMRVILAAKSDAEAIYDQLLTRLERAIRRMTGLQLVALTMHVTDVQTRREWQQANA